ncbi:MULTISPECIES: hypothetical protein [Streptomyces]|uniref:hypothetical protein n=1 Tax=Streptomyces TaxID=1883 RepID=UPI0029B05820|nr:hypothetical protein [Streptomyces sp. WI03-4A]MDX2591968.1 hypothetical protein [Streptomyces sp. WI03-4A]
MSSIVLAMIVVMVLLLSVTGVLAMTTGRIALPWVRKGVKRPRLWGAGALLIAASLTMAWLVPFRGQSLLMLAGLLLTWRAQGWRHRETRPRELIRQEQRRQT